MFTIISIFLVYITLINSVILLAFFFRRKFNHPIEEHSFEAASVIIAFKNEKENLPELIQALKSQSIPKEKIEVIFIDDYSTDNSLEALNLITKEFTHFKVIKNKYKPGKKNALKTGIEEAKHDILILTDADCIPGKNWLNSILKSFTPDIDIVYGYSPFISQKSFLNKICQYENLFTSVLMQAFQNVEFPYMSFGRNLAYRKSLFNRLGGFQQIEHSISGDDDLFFQLALTNGAKAKLIYDPENIVFTKCNYNFKEYFNRKTRHISASKFYKQDIKVALGLIYISNILINIFLVPSLLSLDLFLVTFIIMNWLIKGIMIYDFNKQLKLNYPVYLIPIVDFLYFLMLLFIGIRSRFKVVRWK